MALEYHAINIVEISYFTENEKFILNRINESVRAMCTLTIVQPHFFHAVLGRSDSTILYHS